MCGVETLLAVVRSFKEFLEENDSWTEDDLFDLETDIVSIVLLNEFPTLKINYKTATYDEEEKLIEVEWDVSKTTQKLNKDWNAETITKNSRKVIESAIKSIQKNFNILH